MRLVLINWSQRYSVDVAEFDEQHKKLVGLINDLNDAMRVGKGKAVLGGILHELTTYTTSHFKAEEKCFARFKYPDTFNHRLEHVAFAKKVAKYSEAYANGKMPLTTEVLKFMSDWWKHHILETDKKYSQFFSENGLK